MRIFIYSAVSKKIKIKNMTFKTHAQTFSENKLD